MTSSVNNSMEGYGWERRTKIQFNSLKHIMMENKIYTVSDKKIRTDQCSLST